VSTLDEDLSGQIAALKSSGATTIYREKISGVRAVRTQLAKLTFVSRDATKPPRGKMPRATAKGR
jgi:hypothetical protein